MQPQTWWNRHAESQLQTFQSWVGDASAPSKQFCASYCKHRDFTSVLDIGAGTATFKQSLADAGCAASYTAVDSCMYFIEQAKAKGIATIESDLRAIALNENSFDFAFSRHTWEHQPSFREAASEAIRVCKVEAAHVFFIPPGEQEHINYDKSTDLYHNTYKKQDIEEWAANHADVASIRWETVPGTTEVVLFMRKKQ